MKCLTKLVQVSWIVISSGMCLAAYANESNIREEGAQNADAKSVIITGERFTDTSDTEQIAAQVITATDIRDAGIDNVSDAIVKLAGVYGRKNTRGVQDVDIDLDGFGVNAANNLVVLIDGVRLSESEMSVAVLSSIPIESVARIEIFRGGNSVLYGDGATSGVIQVITKQVGQSPFTGVLTGQLGQFDERYGSASLLRGWEHINLSLNFSDLKTDNFRDNNRLSQQIVSGALTWYGDDARMGLRVDSTRQKFGLPGALTLAQFNLNPHQASTPFDHGTLAQDRATAFIEKNLANWQLVADLSTRERRTDSNFVTFKSIANYSGHKTEFNPRLRRIDPLGAWNNDAVMGVTWMNWNRQTESTFSKVYATQKSTAIYFRNQLSTEKARLIVGARHEVFDKTSSDPDILAGDNYTIVQTVNAWEAQGSYAVAPLTSLFVKTGQSYRVANVDDNSLTPTPNTPLLPQISHDVEIGAEVGNAHQQLIARYFRHNLTNEIYFDPLINNGFGANTNLDPTQRQGVGLQAKWRLSQQFRLALDAQHVNARFTSGPNDGKALALVPNNIVSAYVNWFPNAQQRAYVGVQWVGTQRYGGDFSNACAAVIPSHLTWDAHFAQTIHEWEIGLTGTNLTNKRYFTNAFGCQSGIYPDDGRQLKVQVRYSF